MRILRNQADCDSTCQRAVIALGNFDGVHLGHRAIIDECTALAKSLGAKPALMTFEPHPREFFSKRHEGLRIYTLRQKITLLREAGIELLYLLRFNEQLAATSAQQFVHGILHQQLQARHIVTGFNFAFGKGRSGDADFLAEQAATLGFGYTAIKAVTQKNNEAVSSSAIRTLLTQGDIAGASRLLGRPYQICGRVIRGAQRGRTIGFPTANIALGYRFKPRFGVYAVRMQIDGHWYRGVANIGIKPTFGEHVPLVEVHCFDCDHDFYGKQAIVELVEFIRDERKFDSIELLKAQILTDSQEARKRV